jgi:hypothetical protein
VRPDDGIRAFLRRLSAGPVARMDAGISYAAQTDLLARGWITLHTILVALHGQPGIGARVPAWCITDVGREQSGA